MFASNNNNYINHNNNVKKSDEENDIYLHQDNDRVSSNRNFNLDRPKLSAANRLFLSSLGFVLKD